MSSVLLLVVAMPAPKSKCAPNDERFAWLRRNQFDFFEELPLLKDQSPRHFFNVGKWRGYRNMHDNYNHYRPLALFLPNIWGGSVIAARNKSTLEKNGIKVHLHICILRFGPDNV